MKDIIKSIEDSIEEKEFQIQAPHHVANYMKTITETALGFNYISIESEDDHDESEELEPVKPLLI